MSGYERERGINVENKKLVDFSHPMNLFSIKCSPFLVLTSLASMKIKEQIRKSLPPFI